MRASTGKDRSAFVRLNFLAESRLEDLDFSAEVLIIFEAGRGHDTGGVVFPFAADLVEAGALEGDVCRMEVGNASLASVGGSEGFGRDASCLTELEDAAGISFFR